jgi:hypothetical protein
MKPLPEKTCKRQDSFESRVCECRAFTFVLRVNQIKVMSICCLLYTVKRQRIIVFLILKILQSMVFVEGKENKSENIEHRLGLE